MLKSFFAWFDGLVTIRRAPPYDKPPQQTSSWLWSSARQVWPAALSGLIFSPLWGAADALLPVLLAATLDKFIFPVPSALSDFWYWLLFGFALASRPIMIFIAGAFTYFLFHTKYQLLITRQSHNHMLKQSWSYFQNEFAGRVSNKVMGAGRSSQEVILSTIDAVAYVLAFAIVAISILSLVSFWFMLPLLIWLILYVAMIVLITPRLEKLNEASFAAQSEIAGRVVDAYANIQTVQLFGRTQIEDDFTLEALDDAETKNRRANRVLYFASVFLEFLNALLLASLFSVSLYFFWQGWVTAGAVALALPLGFKVTAMSEWVMHMAAGIFSNLGQLTEALQTTTNDPDMVDVPNAQDLQVERGEIAFKGVNFAYGGEMAVVENLSFKILPGEKIALVGPSGAGKTTITSLLLRLYDIEGGSIEIDGQDISQVSRDSLRSQIAMVTQDTSLLHRSVAENIAYGKVGVTETQIIEAARKAGAWDFIQTLIDPEGRRGLEARVGERGVKLSGGQRQRVALARVLLKDAPIVVFDEATSALDSETESRLQDQLALVSAGKTVITIAHRLSTIQSADRIFVLDQGKIVQEGSHEELTNNPGLYASLWSMQAGGFI